MASARTLCRDMPTRYGKFGDNTLGKRIYEMFGETSTGFFIDLGAAHPWVCNHTDYLEKNGWDGILVEPNVHFIELIEKYRPDTRLVRAAIYTEDGYASFNTGEMGSALAVTGQKCHACYNSPMSVRTVTMATFLEENRDIIPKKIQFLSCDIQYVEHLIYRDLPLAEVIAIEIHLEEYKEEILDYFRGKFYTVEHLGHGDYLLIRMTYSERIKYILNKVKNFLWKKNDSTN